MAKKHKFNAIAGDATRLHIQSLHSEMGAQQIREEIDWAIKVWNSDHISWDPSALAQEIWQKYKEEAGLE